VSAWQPAVVPAVGGTRQVVAPDPIAAHYLRLALRLDQHVPGLVDGYFGPADIKAEIDMDQLRAPVHLRESAARLRERVDREVAEPDRRVWLEAQLVALETHAAVLAGEEVAYATLVERSMGFLPPRYPDSVFDAARRAVDALLPGEAPLPERLEAWDRAVTIPVDRLMDVVDGLVARFRAKAAQAFGLPDGEDLRVRLVTGQPWSGYNWYDGGRRSRVDLNTDLPVRAPDLLRTVAHETYPGHHLEHAWKETDLVDGLGRLEASVLCINTPECLVSEGLADLGVDFAVPDAEHADLLVEVFERAGLPVAVDPAASRALALQAVALSKPRRVLGAIRGNAAFLRHADGRSAEDVLDYLHDVGGYAPDAAAKRLEFIDHPLWRTYVFVYAEGEALLRRWVEAVPPAEREARFGRLLHEQLTPSSILAETVPASG
jgi:hypothetical protein